MVQPPPEEHIRIIYPYLENVRKLIALAINDYDNDCNHIRHKTSPRSRASLIHDNIVYRAKEFFDDMKGVTFQVIRGLFLLIFDYQVFLRFKKLDKKKMPRNIQTQQTLDFMNQQLPLPGIPQVSKMIAGYKFDDFETDFEIYLTYPNGSNSLPWSMLLEPSAEMIIEIPPVVEKDSEKKGVQLKFIEQENKEEKERDETSKS